LKNQYIVIVILAMVAITIGAILTAMAFSETILTNNSSDEPSVSLPDLTMNASSQGTAQPIAVTPTGRPLDNNKTWFTAEEILDAFGPAPAQVPDNATTTGLLKNGGILYPYPNGSQAYYTDYTAAKDTTTDRIIAFLATDDTYKEHNFIDGKFVCVNFAVMLHDRAESRGISTHMASVIFSSGPSFGTGHMINAFNTTDAGWVYVDATETGWVLIGAINSGDKFGGTLMRNQDGKWGFFKAETENIVEKVDII
jgi:hypothetical protein